MARRRQPRADSAASPPNAGANSDCPDAQVFPGKPEEVAEEIIRLVGTVDPASWERLARRLCKNKFFDDLQEGEFTRPVQVLIPLDLFNNILEAGRGRHLLQARLEEVRRKLTRKNPADLAASERLRDLEREGLSDTEIAALIHKTPDTIRKLRYREGRHKEKPSPTDHHH
jgi:hypothetical protein